MTVREVERADGAAVPAVPAVASGDPAAGTPRRWWPLVAAVPVAAAAVLMLTSGEPDTAAAVARTSPSAELCLELAGTPGPVCLDATHREHLPAGGFADGACVEVSWVGDAPTNRTVVGVRAAACPAGAPQ